MTLGRRLPATVVVVMGLLVGLGLPALAGGSWMATTKANYQPGDEVTAVGYVESSGSTYEPYHAYLNLIPGPWQPEVEPIWHDLGTVGIEPSGLRGYLSNRVSIQFMVPGELEEGVYEVAVLTPSGALLGDLIGLMLYVGVEPPSEPRWIEWPLDEPLIDELEGNAVIAGPGFAVEVSDLRNGLLPDHAEEFMLETWRTEPTSTTTTTTPVLAFGTSAFQVIAGSEATNSSSVWVVLSAGLLAVLVALVVTLRSNRWP